MVRFKKRYFIVEVTPEIPTHFHRNGLQEAIVSTVKRLHGDYGVAATTPGFRVKYLNTETRIAFISVGRGPHQLVASALPLITKISGQAATVRTIHLAASMRHGFLFVKKYHEEKIMKLEESLSGGEKVRWKQEKDRLLSRK
ncbi:ribonuclease P/MRP protein subunit POP5 [Procambarus clarkii]|uniref:ribonuclease P/MRP protein subunit POP5 n=1 Tax=Procambarus clarkii TaxID=6728 RepID=UPI001E6755D7|nr:ribonuclease P/MRP protein subunit POP5-like [Procambarus clarkii]